MGERICCRCKKPLNLLSRKATLRDGYLCSHCMKEAHLTSFESANELSVKEVNEYVESRVQIAQTFRVTHRLSAITLDDTHHTFLLNGMYFRFNELLSYVYFENPANPSGIGIDNKKSGATIGGAIGLAGGLLGSAVGAAIGGAIGSVLSKKCKEMYIDINLGSISSRKIRKTFICDEVKTASDEYAKAVKDAQACLAALKIIQSFNESTAHSNTIKGQGAVTDTTQQHIFVQKEHMSAEDIARELQTYNSLLHAGILTQEEFDQKKKDLLSLK